MDRRRCWQPRSVAVVGATERPDSYGGNVLANLRRAGYGGSVTGSTPAARAPSATPCVPSLADLPEPVDAVVVAIPAPGVTAVDRRGGASSAAAGPSSSRRVSPRARPGSSCDRASSAKRARGPVAGLRAERQRGDLRPRAGAALGRFRPAARARAGCPDLPERERRRQRARVAPRNRASTPSSRAATRPCSTRATGSRRSPRRRRALGRPLPGVGRRRRQARRGPRRLRRAGVAVAVLKVGSSEAGAKAARRPHRRPRPATSACSGRWSRRPARPGPPTRTSCSSWRRPSPSRGRAPEGGIGRARGADLLGWRLGRGRRPGRAARHRVAALWRRRRPARSRRCCPRRRRSPTHSTTPR